MSGTLVRVVTSEGLAVGGVDAVLGVADRLVPHAACIDASRASVISATRLTHAS
jgi:hypothetical protein